MEKLSIVNWDVVLNVLLLLVIPVVMADGPLYHLMMGAG